MPPWYPKPCFDVFYLLFVMCHGSFVVEKIKARSPLNLFIIREIEKTPNSRLQSSITSVDIEIYISTRNHITQNDVYVFVIFHISRAACSTSNLEWWIVWVCFLNSSHVPNESPLYTTFCTCTWCQSVYIGILSPATLQLVRHAVLSSLFAFTTWLRWKSADKWIERFSSCASLFKVYTDTKSQCLLFNLK